MTVSTGREHAEKRVAQARAATKRSGGKLKVQHNRSAAKRDWKRGI